MKLMSTINTLSAWVLALCFLLYVLTGFDVQLRFLSPQISSLIHLKYLFLIAQLTFAYHTTFSLYKSLRRKKYWNAAGKSLLGVYAAINLGLFYVYFLIH
jgi:hypothetical protein